MHEENSDQIPPSARQYELYMKLTGEPLPEGVSRIEAARLIEAATSAVLNEERRQQVQAHIEAREAAKIYGAGRAKPQPSQSARKTKKPVPSGLTEVIKGLLYAVPYDRFVAAHLEGATMLLNLTNDTKIMIAGEGQVNVAWWTDESGADEKVLEGLVRLCSSVMKGIDQRIVLVGKTETLAVVAGCVLREYLGVDTSVAKRILQNRRLFLADARFEETIRRYNPS